MPDTKQTIRADILDTAKKYITADRQATHGKPEDSFQTIAEFWSAHLRGRGKLDALEALDRIDVAAMMAGMKLARVAGNPDHIDNWIDGAGYCGCGGEIATLQNKDNGVMSSVAAPVNSDSNYWKPNVADVENIHRIVKDLDRLTINWKDEDAALVLNGMTRPDSFTFDEYNKLIALHARLFKN